MTATEWRPDPMVERMQALHDEDPEQFRVSFGARGLIPIGLHASDKRRAEAAGLDVTTS